MALYWTEKEITGILWQLDQKRLPFAADTIFASNYYTKLGEGGSGYVFDSYSRSNGRNSGVIKVIGFKDAVDYAQIQREVQIQQKLSKRCKYIVKIYDSCCLRVWIDDENQVTKVGMMQEDISEGESADNCITLAFILMEKLEPVIYKDKNIQVKCANEALIGYDNKEVMNLFFDVASALEASHRQKILHGDIKLENIFFDPVKQIYKLGDFGSAVQTVFGVAKAAGYTNGYVAPEVYNCRIKKYDATADVYSLGMVIHVLRNRLKKVGSDNYLPNVDFQYQEGYVLKRPANERSDNAPLFVLLKKMCSYRPSERPSKMKDIIGTIVGSYLRPRYGVQIKFPVAYLAMGLLLIVFGALSGAANFNPWITDLTVLGFVALIKAITLYMRDRKQLKYLFPMKKIDLIYLLSMIAIELWNIVGLCIILDDYITGTDYFYADAPKILFRVIAIEFIVFTIIDNLGKKNMNERMYV